jgi:hypothetical protein
MGLPLFRETVGPSCIAGPLMNFVLVLVLVLALDFFVSVGGFMGRGNRRPLSHFRT